MSSKMKWTRRDWLAFVGGGTLAASPLGALLAALSSRAPRMASEAMGEPAVQYRLVNFFSFDAPPRWTFDQFLNPQNQPGFVRHPHIANGFTSNGGGEYELISMEGIHVPRLWATELSKHGGNGAKRDLRRLLKCMINLRGLDTGTASHPASAQLMQMPVSATSGVAALPALRSSAPFSVVGLGIAPQLGLASAQLSVTAFPNQEIQAIANWDDINWIETLLKPFNLPASPGTTGDTAVRTAVGNVLRAFHNASKANSEKHAILESAWGQASSLIEQDLSDLFAQWPVLFGKYKNIIDPLIIRNSPGWFGLPGLDDFPVMTNNSPLGGQISARLSGDARRLFDPVTGTGAFQPSLDHMAAIFAMTEFLLKQNLTSSITAQLDGIKNLNAGGQPFQQNMDEHPTPMIPSAFMNSRYHLATAACILELIESLEAAGGWNNTVIQLASEFGRYPRMDRSGSDHAFTAASSSIFAGQIEGQGPFILGDIKKTNQGYTWGEGAPVLLPGSTVPTRLNVGVVAASLSTLVNVPSPVTTFTSLFRRNGAGEIESVLPKVGSLV